MRGRVSILRMAWSAYSVWYIRQAPQMMSIRFSMVTICRLALRRMDRGEPSREVKSSVRNPVLAMGTRAATRPPTKKDVKNPVDFSFFSSIPIVIT